MEALLHASPMTASSTQQMKRNGHYDTCHTTYPPEPSLCASLSFLNGSAITASAVPLITISPTPMAKVPLTQGTTCLARSGKELLSLLDCRISFNFGAI